MRTRRNSVRSPCDDYRTPGAYFITICVFDRRPVLSQVVCGRVRASPLGRLVLREWDDLPRRLGWLAIDALVVMPDHLHAILWITDAAARQQPRAASGPPARSVGAALGQLKSRVTKAAVRQGLWPPAERLWQRGYHDRIVRSESGLRAARGYIAANPIRWERDRSLRGGR
jgi:REP-associated tyrosine transposase